MQPHEIRILRTRELNHIIDRVLDDPSEAHQHVILDLVTHYNVYNLAERVRRRSTLLLRSRRKNHQNLLALRDTLIMALYAENSPAGWANAFCDGSSVTVNYERHGGIGVIIYSQTGECIAQTSLPVGNKNAFEAEVEAVALAIHTATAHNLARIRIHTDNKALAYLWRGHRQDSRLAAIYRLAARIEKLQIRAIPRLHNQAANRLAKQAVSN